MGALLPNYTQDMVVQGVNVPHYDKMRDDKSGPPIIFQILKDLRRNRHNKNSIDNNGKIDTPISCPDVITDSNPVYSNQMPASFKTIINPEPVPFRTTTPSETVAKNISKSTARSEPPAPCVHVHKSTIPVCKPGESLALGKVWTPINGRTSVTRLPLMKQEILSHYSGCFERIGCFPGELYKFHLKQECKPARHAPRKVPIHLEDAFKEEIKSLMDQGILEEVKEQTDWVNSCVIVEKDSGNHHSPNHTIKRKLRICLDLRDLNQALEREPYHTHSIDEITTKLKGMTVFTIVDFKKGYWMVVLHPDSRKLTCMALLFGRFQWTRLPMGTMVAQDIFQSKLDAIFLDMEGVTGIADDMVITGRDEMEYDRNFL